MLSHYEMSRNIRKCDFGQMLPAKTQVSLRVQNLYWVHFNKAKDAVLFHVNNDDFDQTARNHRLI